MYAEVRISPYRMYDLIQCMVVLPLQVELSHVKIINEVLGHLASKRPRVPNSTLPVISTGNVARRCDVFCDKKNTSCVLFFKHCA
jgi:hypothetical protein